LIPSRVRVKFAGIMDQWLLVYIAIGAFIGFFAGMLGMGGGGIQVPLTTMAFAAQGFPREHMLHVALGTAMATVIFTSVSSLRAHNRHKAVNWDVLRRVIPGIVVGTGLGTVVARHIPTFPLAVIFTAFVLYMASSMLFSWKAKPTRHLPGPVGLSIAGTVIGVCSALAAMGGATLTIPFLVFCNVPFHTAIGTASAVGFPIAVVGSIGYLVNGWGAAGLPAQSVGYIYVPALVGFTVGSIVLAPIGARLAHRTSERSLKRIFAIVIGALGLKMLVSLA
jgi:uncharacterized membrane protein YfcA